MQEPSRKQRDTAEAPDQAPANDEVTNPAAALAAEGTVAHQAPSEAAPNEAETLSQENADLKDRLLRALAEMENLRRRTERDFLSRLTRHGVKKLEPQGQRFDPNLHEALFEVPDESVPAGTVVQVIESGYTIGDRVLRPAKVGVSKGGPKV